MITKYIKVSLRRIFRQKRISLINIVGLAIGFSLSFIVLIYLLNETSYDKQHLNKEHIFRLIKNYRPEASDDNYGTQIYEEHYRQIESEFPEIEKSSGIYKIFGELTLKNKSEKFSDFDLIFAEPDIMKIFTLPIVYGNKNDLLKNPFDVVITQSKAQKYFNKENPIGKTLNLYTKADTILLTVKGVIKDFPYNSTFNPEIICSYNASYQWKDYVALEEVYLLLSEKTNYKELEKKLPVKKVNYGTVMLTEFKLQPFNDIYFHSNFIRNYTKPKGNLLNVIILSIVGIIILIVSINNFLIFSVFDGRSILKDLTIRKIFGASMKSLSNQYFINAFVYSIFALLVSILLVYLFIPVFNQLSAVNLFKTISENIGYVFAMVLILTITVIISGSYLAIYVSSQNPIRLFRSSFATIKSKNSFQKGIVIFQMFLFTGLTEFAILVNSQINFAMEKDAGYEKSGLMYLKLDNADKSAVIKSEIKKLPFIESVTSVYKDIPTHNLAKMHLPKYQNSTENVVLNVLFVGKEFFKTMNIKFCNENRTQLSLEKGKYIVNKAAALKLNIDPKLENIQLSGKDKQTYRIAGVCENFDIQGIQHETFPMAIIFSEKPMANLIIKLQHDYKQTVVDKVIREIDVDLGFATFAFKDKMFDAYKSEANFLKTISIGSLIVIIISSIGLFNVIILTLKQKTKEITIRKVLGANGISINGLIFKEFVLMLITANILAVPVSFLSIKLWLQNFAYHVNINSFIFVSTAFISILIVILITFVNVQILLRKNISSTLNVE